MTLLVEAINTIDIPGYFASTAAIAADLVVSADSPHVRLQLDQYHVGMMGEDVRAVLRRHFPLVAHVQIADVPGRHQPGTGHQPIAAFLSDLDELGYSGSVGLEYRPQGTTDEALSWLPHPARA
jgi:hydroxypyruvate isomerase